MVSLTLNTLDHRCCFVCGTAMMITTRVHLVIRITDQFEYGLFTSLSHVYVTVLVSM